MLVLGYLAVDLARMGTSASPAGAPPELLFERCAFLLQRSLGFFQFFLTSNETCPPLTHLLPIPSSRRRGRGWLHGAFVPLRGCRDGRWCLVAGVSRRILGYHHVSIRGACGKALQRGMMTPCAGPDDGP